jgi:RecJ-like exonuclease
MEADARKAAGMIRDAGSVLVVSHIDADGITAGSIAATTLARLGKPYRIRFEKKMSEDTVSMINGAPEDLVWICDLGSGYLSDFSRPGIVVTDHHVPDPRWRRKQTVLDDFEDVCHVNPHVYGMDGSREVCGAGMTYVVSKAVDPANADLCYLAIVGACGDFQDSDESRLVGYNRVILAEAEGLGLVLSEEDVRLFGRETRNLVQFLQYSGDRFCRV